jgi:hypothetical protein
VFKPVVVAFFFNFIQVSSGVYCLLQGLNGLIPVAFRRWYLCFLANLVKELVEPVVQVLIKEEIEALVLFLELQLCHFDVGDIWPGWRGKFDLTNNIVKDLCDLTIENDRVDGGVEEGAAVLPLVKDVCSCVEFEVGYFGAEGRLATDFYFFGEVSWEIGEETEEKGGLLCWLYDHVLVVAVKL